MGVIDEIAALKDAAVRFVRFDLWSAAVYRQAQHPAQRVGILIARTLYLVWTGFARERLRLRAAALTYMTMLSLVPALAVIFSLFTAFGGLRDAQGRVKNVVIQWLSVSHQDAVTEYLDKFVGSVHAGAIGGFGVLILMLTALGLLANIEKSFNDIWGLKANRSLLRRFQNYWPLLTLGPLLFGVSLTATASIESSEAARTLFAFFPGSRALLRLGPLLFVWVGFSLMYIIMPNTRVPVRYALIGGVVAGTMWEVAKQLYAVYASRAITYSAIYGSLGVVPLSIIWIYVSWLIALTGGLLTFASQNAKTYEPDQDVSNRASQHDRERFAAQLVLAVFARFEGGHGPVPVDDVLEASNGPPRVLRRVLTDLVEGGLLLATGPDHDAFVPGKPAHCTTLCDIIGVLRIGDHPGRDSRSPTDPGDRAGALLDTAWQTTRASLARVSVAQLLASEETAADASAEAEPVLADT